ncbi:hypothetical protein D8674_034697 [Pyrus ussuriensis x Pyrus communis]|uniref:Uncharacterized protein n=1 Tax=Pyrus ussuriensis x Pyrus communis TaxID=2448454 RepID=A0A5N5GF18_9ROSA|nr:hypothetical protein D8674_034697 [Pyrus ussuriensis x Pyrus communis]
MQKVEMEGKEGRRARKRGRGKMQMVEKEGKEGRMTRKRWESDCCGPQAGARSGC